MASIHELSPDDIAQIKAKLLSGQFQHEIAAEYGLNQGRISEINTGKRFCQIQPALEKRHEH